MATRKPSRKPAAKAGKRRPSEDAPGPGVAYFATREEAASYAPSGLKPVRLVKGWALARGWAEFLDTDGDVVSFGAMRLHDGGYLPGTPKSIIAMNAARDELAAALRGRREPDMRVIEAARALGDMMDVGDLGMMMEDFRRKGGQISPAEVRKQESHERTLSVAKCEDIIRKAEAKWKSAIDARDVEWKGVVQQHKDREDTLERMLREQRGTVESLMKQCARPMATARTAAAPAASSSAPAPAPASGGFLSRLFGGNK